MDKKLYDDCFYMERKSFGTWQSFDKEGKGLVTSLTEENCIAATRFYLKGLQDRYYKSVVEKDD